MLLQVQCRNVFCKSAKPFGLRVSEEAFLKALLGTGVVFALENTSPSPCGCMAGEMRCILSVTDSLAGWSVHTCSASSLQRVLCCNDYFWKVSWPRMMHRTIEALHHRRQRKRVKELVECDRKPTGDQCVILQAPQMEFVLPAFTGSEYISETKRSFLWLRGCSKFST